jgi:hypothetical protein
MTETEKKVQRVALAARAAVRARKAAERRGRDPKHSGDPCASCVDADNSAEWGCSPCDGCVFAPDDTARVRAGFDGGLR